MMDPQSLITLLQHSTDRLSSLHLQLGHPPERLQEAVAALHATLHAAIEGQLHVVEKEVEGAEIQLQRGNQRIHILLIALGDDQHASQPRRSSGLNIRKKQQQRDSMPSSQQPLLSRLDTMSSELSRLQNLYHSRASQADKLTTQLDSFRPILGDFVPHITTQSTQANEGQQEETDEGQQPLAIIPAAHLTHLSTTIDKCGCELSRRSEEVQQHLIAILGLWSELCLPPQTEASPSSSSSSSTEPTFDSLILRHLQLTPGFTDVEIEEDGQGSITVKEFQGDFWPLEALSDDGPQQFDTPTRSTRSSASATLQSVRSAETHFPAHVLLPTPTNIALARDREQELRQEKTRRENRIQELYDDLVELWVKFNVDPEEMEAFVQQNSGSTLSIIESYESELLKMNELKIKHLAIFLGNVRSQIEDLWAQLRLSDEEKEISFPNFFRPVETIDSGEVDDLLARHEERVKELQIEVQGKGPVLKLVAKYFEVLDEERQLDESSKDSTRLMKGVRGDPGRLLREEKMRKRVKIQKPKIEADLLKAIPVWETENERAFTIDGERYYDKILALVEESNPALRKRGRAASVAATPSAANATGVLHPNTIHTNRIAATPLRTPSVMGPRGETAASTGAAGNKRPRLVQSANPTRTVTATPAGPGGLTNGNLRARVPPPSCASTSASSRIPSAAAAAASGGARVPVPATAKGRVGSTSPSKMSQGGGLFAGKVARNVATGIGLPAGGSAGFAVAHHFRPRPSAILSQQQQQRTISGMSVSSEATTLHYPTGNGRSDSGSGSRQDSISLPVPYASAIPFKASSAGGSGGQSVNKANKIMKRGPSMSLEGALASLSASAAIGGGIRALSNHNNRSSRDHAYLQSHSVEGGAGGGSGGNWALLEEEDDDDDVNDDEHYASRRVTGARDEMQVF